MEPAGSSACVRSIFEGGSLLEMAQPRPKPWPEFRQLLFFTVLTHAPARISVLTVEPVLSPIGPQPVRIYQRCELTVLVGVLDGAVTEGGCTLLGV